MDNIDVLVATKCVMTEEGFFPGWGYFNQGDVSQLTKLTDDNYKLVFSKMAPDQQTASKLASGYEFFKTNYNNTSEEQFYQDLEDLFL